MVNTKTQHKYVVSIGVKPVFVGLMAQKYLRLLPTPQSNSLQICWQIQSLVTAKLQQKCQIGFYRWFKKLNLFCVELSRTTQVIKNHRSGQSPAWNLTLTGVGFQVSRYRSWRSDYRNRINNKLTA